MANPKKPAGDFGEDIACAHLSQHGFTCLERNFRTRFGEVDIIARNERFLAFVEVKTRGPGARVSGEESVDYRKRQRLRYAAEYYLMKHHSNLQPRFDVICVNTARDGQVVSIKWYENAF